MMKTEKKIDPNFLQNAISPESKKLSEMVQDSSLSLLDRVESYEDIINIEVGDTALSRARNIERETGFRQLYLKFEGGNPTGTQKDRIAFAQCLDALRRGYDTITVATCGNYGASVALAAYLAGLRCIIHIPKNYHTDRIHEMEAAKAEVHSIEGSYEDTVRVSSEMALVEGWYDANPGGSNTALQIMAYAEIADEIYDQLRDAPKIIAVPVSNGTLLAGIYRGFVSLYKRGKTSRIPMMVAASSSHKNPIVHSFKKGLENCVDLIPDKIKETVVNEPLINWHSFDGEEALYALRQSNGSAYNVSDEKMLKVSKMLKEKEGLHVLPASTAGLEALLEMDHKTELEPDRYVAILTSRR
ncbi:pyridoxal-phosphate dependent enzyme [Reichenbachiella agarivorans]|uniref:Pyridoxal-phosphate dependent enzyme n=1 Tax=Reichenbachiella agarivorans TaxID=2979464 RepID=A0ABY6CMP0_9BACT|nr:pyridoxal-phosphate dependent enzyme [Reichenbachiella agarivorans]UXP31779.1 pyridoxal-phosphate dependent enzyme [Reichenbachiella agarivorans]